MEQNTIETSIDASKTTVISQEILLKHWQGHRGLTRKVIEAFPEEKLFTYSLAACAHSQNWRWKWSGWVPLESAGW
ncbi:MAG: hypothetical protein ABIR06_15005 [Cyclobacteriaceae bacterium]